jgi:multidrug efflux pump subunit AcrB
MEQVKELVDKVLKNRSLTIFLGIVVVALFMGWVGG